MSLRGEGPGYLQKSLPSPHVPLLTLVWAVEGGPFWPDFHG